MKARIEIVHESLPSKWPRLVHSQTQDAEGAQLRHELRQAAQVWRQRSNLRVVADAKAPNGYKLDVGSFPGWEQVPDW